MPPSSSPPPARPGPPCTRWGSGEPCPVDSPALSRSSTCSRPWCAAAPSTTSRTNVGVVADDRGDEAALAEGHEVDDLRRGVVRQQRRDRAERLDVVDGGCGRVLVAQQQGLQERAALEAGDPGVGVADHDLAARGEAGHGVADGVALRGAHQRAHARRRVARVADDDLAERRPQRLGGRVEVLAGDERPPDRGALLAGLGRHLAHDLAHEQVELLGAGLGVEAQHRAVQRVGLGVEAHPALDDGRVRAQQRGRSRPSR